MLQCWGGFNYEGQLGTGTTNEVVTPTWVKHIHDVKKLELGDDETCAIVGSGALYCWGRNQFIKDDSRKNFPDPTLVPGLSSVVDVAVGDHHVCAVDSAGDVYCWGRNSDGQLGLGAARLREEVREPTRVRGVRDAVGVAASTWETYAWTKGGELYRWGSTSDRPQPWAAPEPRLVDGVSGVKRAWAAGQNACAEIADRQIRCFIPDSLAALAAGKQYDLGPEMRAFAQALTRRKNIVLPKMIVPDARELRDVADVLVFHHDASALTGSGEVFSWGNPERGTIGRPERTKGLLPPTRIAGLSGVTQIAGGFMHRCALLKDGSVSCFGGRAPGRRGKGGKFDRRGLEVPMVVSGLPKVKQIAAGDHCTFAIGEDNTLWAFGDSWINACGEKESDTVSFETPRRVPLDARPPS